MNQTMNTTLLNRLWSVALALLLPALSWAATEKFVHRTVAADWQFAPVMMGEVQDDKYSDLVAGTWTSAFALGAVDNYVLLGVDPNIFTGTTPFTIEVDVSVTAYDFAAPMIGIPKGPITLLVNYDPSVPGIEQAQEYFHFEGYHHFQLAVTDLRIDGVSETDLTQVPTSVYLESHLHVERFYNLKTITPLAEYKQTYTPSSNELNIYWEHRRGAEYYDLEWTYVNDYGKSFGATLPTTELFFDEHYFRLNSTRIQTTAQHYRLPVLYDHGYLVYRLRPVGTNGSDPLVGEWTTSGFVYPNKTLDEFKLQVTNFGALNRGIVAIQGHEESMNWQRTTAFAEDGKRKDVISYFDGSLRSRQEVTMLNTDDEAIVGETMYDSHGRQAVKVMPAPSATKIIQFHDNFNVNGAGLPYSADDFDFQPGGAAVATPPMANTSGAARYFGPRTVVSDTEEDFLPDSEGYPFSYTQYTADNTGRVRKTTNVGEIFQVGGGRETVYYYGSPAQEELDRMFGSSIGYSRYYRKNISIDPNGQAYITYVDPRGRTIATCLSGNDPDNLETLPGLQTETLLFDLLSKDADVDPDDDQDGNDRYETGRFPSLEDGLEANHIALVATPATPHQFDYQAEATDYYTDVCLPGVHYEYVYDLLLTLADPSGAPLFTNGSGLFTGQRVTLNDVSTPLNLDEQIDLDLEVGEHNLYKSLTVNADTVDSLATAYVEALETYAESLGGGLECFKTFQEFLDEELVITDSSDCFYDCQDCVNDLIAELGERNLAIDVDEWDERYADCMETCLTPSPCYLARQEMLQDVSPGGQYGETSDANDAIDLSVFKINSKRQNDHIYWQVPASPYLDEEGSQSYVSVTWDAVAGAWDPPIQGGVTPVNGQVLPQELSFRADFISEWKASWAESLLPGHPEYCYLDNWCDEFDDYRDVGNSGLTSYRYDELMGTLGARPTNDEVDPTDYLAAYGLPSSDFQTFDLRPTELHLLDDLLDADPFWNSPLVTSVLPSPVGGHKTYFKQNYLEDYHHSGEDLVWVVANTYSCGGFYSLRPIPFFVFNGHCPNFENFDALMAAADGTPNEAEKDVLFQTVLSMYVAEKQFYVDSLMQEQAITQGCYNGCFGGGFNPLLYHFLDLRDVSNLPQILASPLFQSNQNCNIDEDELYETVAARFFATGEDGLKNDGNQDDETEEGEEEAEANALEILESTGRCLLAFELEGFLNGLARDGHLGVLNTPLELAYESDLFSFGLYSAITGKDRLDFFTPLTYTQALAPGDNYTLVGTFSDGASINQTLTITLPQSFQDWTTVSTWEVEHFIELVPGETASGITPFGVRLRVDDDLDPATPRLEVILAGEALLDLNACKETLLNIVGDNEALIDCEATNMATELLALMNVLQAEGDLFSNPRAIVAAQLNSPQAVTLSQGDFSSSDLFSFMYEADQLVFPPPYYHYMAWFYEDHGGSGPYEFWLTTRDGSNDLEKRLILETVGGVNPATLINSNTIITSITPKINGYNVELELYDQVTEQYSELLLSYRMRCDVGDCELTLGSCDGPNTLIDDECCTFDMFEAGLNDLFDQAMQNYLAGIPLQTVTLDNFVLESYFNSQQVDLDVNYSTFPFFIEISGNSCDLIFNIPEDIFLNTTSYDSHSLDIPSFYRFFDPITTTVTGRWSLELTDAIGDHFTRYTDFDLCTPIPNCEICIPEAFPPVDCGEVYPDYAALPGGVLEYLNEADFCEAAVAHVARPYVDYINALSITSMNDPYWLSIDTFGWFSLQHYVEDFLNYVNFWSSAPLPGTSGFLTLQEFADTNITSYCMEVYGHSVTYWDSVSLGYDPRTSFVLDYRQVPIGTLCECDEGPCFPPSYPEIIVVPDDPCQAWLEGIAEYNAEERYEEQIHRTELDFKEAYINGAMSTVVETLTKEFDDKSYYYTLYYYDQGGSLVRTVPPQGFHAITDPATLDAVKVARQDPGLPMVAPAHDMATTYTYNTLGQLRRQRTPDGNVSLFRYDDLGRVISTQTAEQIANHEYSYVIYDGLGRTAETGELQLTAPLTDTDFDDPTFPDNVTTSGLERKSVVRTQYDYYATTFQPFAGESNELRDRIAQTTYYELYSTDPDAYQYSSHYRYDIHGNVASMIQENKALELYGHSQKRVDYHYDLISGNMHEVCYSPGGVDQFMHRYFYDADNRLTNVETSTDGFLWENDAKYLYYRHGPIARVELGDRQVQGTDYAYTLQGWLKGVNSQTLQEARDMGHDNLQNGSNLNRHFAKDEMAFSLRYFDDDYQGVAENLIGNQAFFLADASGNTEIDNRSLYNGNISSMTTALRRFMEVGGTPDQYKPMTYVYDYDQLNRLAGATKVDAFITNNTFEPTGLSQKHETRYTYDLNGNLLSLSRRDQSGTLMDDLTYHYYDDPFGNPINRLAQVNDGVTTAIADDLEDQTDPENYKYDESGRLIADVSERIDEIIWHPNGKVRAIKRDLSACPGDCPPDVYFEYDANGRRIMKVERPRDGSTGVGLTPITTYYFYDANGQVMAVYKLKATIDEDENDTFSHVDHLSLEEHHIYGAKRLGLQRYTDRELAWIKFSFFGVSNLQGGGN